MQTVFSIVVLGSSMSLPANKEVKRCVKIPFCSFSSPIDYEDSLYIQTHLCSKRGDPEGLGQAVGPEQTTLRKKKARNFISLNETGKASTHFQELQPAGRDPLFPFFFVTAEGSLMDVFTHVYTID